MTTATKTGAAEAGRPRPGTYLDLARGLRPLIERHRAQADAQARMAPRVTAALRQAGFFTLQAPREAGGAEIGLPEFLLLQEELGAADPSVAWHVQNCTPLCLAAACLPAATRDEIFAARPGPFGVGLLAGGAEPARGGFRLTGRVPFITGVNDASWVVLLAIVLGGGDPAGHDPPEIRRFIVPTADLAIERTWDAAVALRGTGSDAATLHGVFVPADRALDPRTRQLQIARPVFRLPDLVVQTPGIPAIAIGITRRAAEEATRIVAAPSSGPAQRRELVHVQARIGEAHAALDMLSAGLQSLASAFWTSAETGEVPDPIRARLYAGSFYALDQARRIASDLLPLVGSAGYTGPNLVETGLRDLHAVCGPAELMRSAQEAAGRVELGLPPALPSLF